MKVTFSNPQIIYEQGTRENNEDYYYPQKWKKTQNNCIILCDGVGGNSYGEKASQYVCKFLGKYFKKNPIEDFSKEPIEIAINETVFYLYKKIIKNPEYSEMTTTVVMSLFHSQGATVVWLGDSRLYHIRNDKILYKTKDHSLVQELVDIDSITPEEALVDERKNIITNSISGYGYDTIGYYEIMDIQPDDYFFLCSDGILESIHDDQLVDILSSNRSDLQKKSEILDACRENSNDNFTGILIKIDEVEAYTDE